MPDTLRQQLGHVPDRHFTTWLEKGLAAALGVLFVVLLLVALLLLDTRAEVSTVQANQAEIQTNQAEGKERGYVNRAQDCRILVALGVDLAEGDDCLIPEVVRHFDPDLPPVTGANSKGQLRNLALLCRILADQGQTDPACLAR